LTKGVFARVSLASTSELLPEWALGLFGFIYTFLIFLFLRVDFLISLF